MGTFKDELRRYPKPRSSAIKAHLKEWLEHPEADAVWQKVSKAAGANLTPEEFIDVVIRARAAARGLPHRIKGNAQDRSQVIKWHQPRIRQALASSSMTLSQIADVLEYAAFEMRQIEKFSNMDLADYPVGAISSKDQKGSQSRRAFCLIMFEFFQQRCDRWMDAEVAALLDSALPRDEATTVDEVREFRKSRPPRDRTPMH
ncbi:MULTISPECIES: hypothetical protein [unclassified Bradyrhizobium]